MAASAVDGALLAVATAAREEAREAKRQRALAMDAIVDLLIERAALRLLLEAVVPYAPDETAAAIRRALAS